MTRTEWIIARNFAVSALLVGGYFSTSPQLFSQGCSPPGPPTDGPCGQSYAICDSQALQTCLNHGGTCTTCNVSNTYASCKSTYNSCIAGEQVDCNAGAGCTGLDNYPTCELTYQEQCNCSCACYGDPPNCPNPVCGGGVWTCDSPIVVDTTGQGFHFTSAENGVYFDLWADGLIRKFAWTDPAFHNGWLALDRNHNGIIDDGSELFGNATPQPSPPEGKLRNGFNALSVYDEPSNGGNGNGLIDPGDSIYSQLLVWQDDNHDGISQPSELKHLQDVGLYAIDLQYEESKRVDQFGNAFYYRARAWDVNGKTLGHRTYDVYLVAAAP